MRAQLAFDRFYLESEQPQPSLAGHVGVELTEPAGRGAARIGEGRLPLLLAPAIQSGEGVMRQVHLAPDLHERWMAAAFEREGDIREGLQVGGDILADYAVAPGGPDREAAALVGEAHGGAVDLHLGSVTGAHHFRCEPPVALLPGRKLLG